MGIKEKIRALPGLPGVYLFKDREQRIIYIGKAASIKKRLKTHFLQCKKAHQSARNLTGVKTYNNGFSKGGSSRHGMLLNNIADLDYILTSDESTALLLEAALIKRYNPRYNVLLKDDKSYPRLKLTLNEDYPRLLIVRKIKPDGALYFGPYTNAKLLREAFKLMRRVFPLRTCQKISRQANQRGCLDFHIGQCIGPCLDSGRKREYLAIVEELRLFLEGKQKELIELLKSQMKRSAAEKDYENAARIRNRIQALSVVSGQGRHSDKALSAYPGRIPVVTPLQIEELRSLLKLPHALRIIEAFDVSNTSGKEAVGSMVSFIDGKPSKDRYMHFKIKTVHVIDDYSMMREIVSRRYRRLLSERGIFPDLIIIDGGKGHLAASKAELRALKIINIPVIGIAKNPDKIYTHERKDPVLLGKFAQALLFCERIRDEAHRFAISYHRLLRRKGISVSELDEIKGIGPIRKAELIKYFGSLDKIKTADINELKKVDFVDEKEAKAVYDYFR